MAQVIGRVVAAKLKMVQTFLVQFQTILLHGLEEWHTRAGNGHLLELGLITGHITTVGLYRFTKCHTPAIR